MGLITSTIKLTLDQGALDRLLGSTSGPVGQEMDRIGRAIKNEAVALVSNDMVNVRSGYLRRSTDYKVFTQGRQVGVAVGSGAPYSVFLTLGTRNMTARPYLQEAGRRILGASLI